MVGLKAADLKVLVVDDYRSMRMLLRRMLNEMGIIQIDEAANGRVALERLTSPSGMPDLVICDLHMEEMDGLEFLQTARRDEAVRNRQVPVLILTGESDPLLLEVVAQVGAAAVIHKPISTPDLAKRIEQIIGFKLIVEKV